MKNYFVFLRAVFLALAASALPSSVSNDTAPFKRVLLLADILVATDILTSPSMTNSLKVFTILTFFIFISRQICSSQLRNNIPISPNDNIVSLFFCLLNRDDFTVQLSRTSYSVIKSISYIEIDQLLY